MTATLTETFAPAIEHLVADIDEAGDKVLNNYTLADAIREGSTVSTQAYNWGAGESACALSAAFIACSARGYC